MMVFLIILGVVIWMALWATGSYNSLVRLHALVEEAWSGIAVQLKRRYDLVPNLVAVVKQYSIHEKDVLEKVTQYRAAAMGAQTIAQHTDAEKGLTSALKTLFAVAENYPTLKANENFMHLQQQLVLIESEIQLGRRYYNGAARNYNIAVASFPGIIIANMLHFAKVSYFQASGDEQENPRIQF